MTDDTQEVTAEQLRTKRHTAGHKLLLHYTMSGSPDGHDADLYAMNIRGDLTEYERGALIALLMSTFPPDMTEALVQAWFKGAGYPNVTLMDNPVQDARFWADGANSKEIDAYAMACFNRMSAKRKAQFVKWAESKVGDNA